MATTVDDVINEAVILLNDPNKRLFTNDKLLPLIKKAYRELGVELHNNGAPLLREVSDIINVSANSTDFSYKILEEDGTQRLGLDGLPEIGSNQPEDIVIPIRLKERGDGDGNFSPMENRYWEPTDNPGASLRYWSWREEEIKFLGAITDRQVIIYYRKSLRALVELTDTVPYANAINFLSPRAAALAARFIGNNNTKADKLDIDAHINLGKLVSRTVKGSQSITSRRRSYWQYLRNRQQGNNDA